MADLPRSIAFYRDLLGFRVLTSVDVEGADADKLLRLESVVQRSVFLERDGVRLALFEFASPKATGDGKPRAMNERGMAAIMLRVDDLEATLASCRKAGVAVLEETRTDYPEFGSRLVFVTDPDGVLIEFVEIPGDPYKPFGKPWQD